MATTKVPRRYGYGKGPYLPSQIVEGQELIDTNNGAHTLDTGGVRVRLNPPKDYNSILNTPDFSVLDGKIEAIRAYGAGVKVYGVLWDKTTSAMTRLYDAAEITTDTTNFVYSGSVNANYSNPFDDIYPWSECKQCNVDLAAYRALGPGDDILDAVTAWYGDPDFVSGGSNGFVGRYTPEFWYKGFEDERGKIVLIADGYVEGFHHHKASIRSHGFAVDDGNNGVTSNDGQPLTNVAVSTIHSRAKTSGFSIMDIYELDAEIALYFVEFGNTDSQNKLGNGCSDCYSQPSATIGSSGTALTEALVPVAMKAYCVPGATLDFGASAGAVVLANRRTVVSVEDYDSTYCKVTFTPALDLDTSMYASIHGKNNADSIGNKSGYVGVNGKNNSWYRGAIMYANRWQYTLGIARQTGTNHIWLCSESTCDNYDALDTGAFYDTGITLYTPSSASWQNVADYDIPDALSAFGPITKAGAVIGDQQYCPLASTGNTILFFGGSAGSGALCGVLCAVWDGTASGSYWSYAAVALLK